MRNETAQAIEAVRTRTQLAGGQVNTPLETAVTQVGEAMAECWTLLAAVSQAIRREEASGGSLVAGRTAELEQKLKVVESAATAFRKHGERFLRVLGELDRAEKTIRADLFLAGETGVEVSDIQQLIAARQRVKP